MALNLHQPQECWDYRCVSSHLASNNFITKTLTISCTGPKREQQTICEVSIIAIWRRLLYIKTVTLKNTEEELTLCYLKKKKNLEKAIKPSVIPSSLRHHCFKDYLTPSLINWQCHLLLAARLEIPEPGHRPSPSATSERSSLASLCCPSATFTATARQMAPNFLSRERTPASLVYLLQMKTFYFWINTTCK